MKRLINENSSHWVWYFRFIAAYYLSKNIITSYEKEDHFGGHSHTVDIKTDKENISVDVGFIVFNELTYPNLINFLKK